MEVLIEYWDLILLVVGLIGFVGLWIHYSLTTPTKTRQEQISKWLLFAVTEIEKAYGSKTGRIKFGKVLDMFTERYPLVSKFISPVLFELLVEQALIEMRHLLETNQNVKELVDKEVK